MNKLLTLFNRAYQSLRLLFDPAIEGNPYWPENKTNRTYKSNKSYWLLRRYVLQGT